MTAATAPAETARAYETIGLWVETDGRHKGDLVIDMPPTWNLEMLALPGCRFDRHTLRYTMPWTWNSLQSLMAMSKRIGWKLAPSDEVREWGYEQSRAWAQLRKASALVRSGDKTEDGYYLHQADGADWLLAAPETNVGRLLQDATGAGKTATTIRAIVQGQIPGPILIVCLEAAMETAWAADFATWAPALRVEQVVGTITARRKILARLKDGEIDVAIIGHSNLKSHTRFEAYGSAGLRRCVKCGGPRLTSGRVDEKGKPLPDIDYHRRWVKLVRQGAKVVAVCGKDECDWRGSFHDLPGEAAKELMAHAVTGRKISELTEAQCQRHLKELNEIPLQLVVVDELHRAMNPSSQFTQAVWGVCNFSADGGRVPNHRRWGLTGTPVSKRSDQAWPPLHWISPQGWPTKGSWVSYFCLEERGWDGYPRVERFQPDKVDEFQTLYSAVTRRVLKEQVINLPPRIRWGSLERRLDMGTAQRKQYVSMRDEMLLAVEAGLITAQNAAAAAGRLSMLASGCGRPDPHNKPGGPQKMLMEAPSCKLDAIVADFRSGEFDGQQIGMTFASAQVLYMIKQGLIDAKVLRPQDISVIAGQISKPDVDRAVRQFQEGRTRVVMLTYAKGGASITLTAASTVLCVQRDWNPINNLQGMDRFYRIGSERHESINVFDYVTRGTNEVAQLRRLDENAQTLEEVVQDRKRIAEWFS